MIRALRLTLAVAMLPALLAAALAAATPPTAVLPVAAAADDGHAGVRLADVDPCQRAPRAPFADVADGASAAAAIDCLVWHDIVRGVGHSRFAPGDALRRDHLASLLARTIDAVGVVLPPVDGPRFADVSGVHADAVERLAAVGVVHGRSATRFAPTQPVRRDQLASLALRTATVVAGITASGDHGFADLDGNVHAAAIGAAVTLGLLQGTSATTFDPAAPATRAQTAVVVTRLLHLLVATATIDDPDAATALGPPRVPAEPSSLRIGVIPASLRAQMERSTWRPGCPVGPDRLRLVQVVHLDLDGVHRWGQVVVHTDVADDVGHALLALHDRRFPIARMEPIEHFGGDDDASMAANNTSAFNCRRVTGGRRFSEHADGTAIDINPVHNPYVRGSTVLPAGGSSYLDRSVVRDGMLTRPGAVEVFDAIGWGWGGDYTSLKDYQHLSANGR